MYGLKFYHPLIPPLPDQANELTKDSFIDKKLRRYYSDKLYKAKFTNGLLALFYALIEHKSYPEHFVSFQVLLYKVKIWEFFIKQYNANRKAQIKQKKKNPDIVVDPTLKYLPPIIPMVLYHGKQEWKVPLDFKSLIDPNRPDEFDKYIPDFQYEFVNLSGIPDKDIKGEIYYQVAMRLMKHIYSPDLKSRLFDFMELLESNYNNGTYNRRDVLDRLEAIIEYLLASTSLTEKFIGNIVDCSVFFIYPERVYFKMFWFQDFYI